MTTQTLNKIDSLIDSERIGAEYAKRGTISRSPYPDENRWLWYYEPDDEKWNAFQYGHGEESQRMRVMESKMKTLIDGGRVVVGDLWMDQVSQTDYGSEIRTCRNRNRCGIHDAYVAWIHDSAKPKDLEFKVGYAIGSV